MSDGEAPPLVWTPILYDIAHSLESVEEPEVRTDRILRLMRQSVPYDRCALLEAVPVLSRPISILPAASAEEQEELSSRLRTWLELLSERPLEEMRRVVLPRVSGRVHLAVPIIGLGETTGIVFVERTSPPYDQTHLAILSVVAAQIGAYLTAVRSDRELRSSEARFRRLYESGMIGIAFMDAGGAITDANDTFASIVERSRGELATKSVNWFGITSSEHGQRDRGAIRHAIERGWCTPYEKRFVRRDGRPVTVLVGAARLDHENSLVAFILDVSERKRIETERADLLKQRESDLEFLEMFMGMLGHDLRNPLGAIRMSAERLRRSDADRLGNTTARILSSTARMERMVEQLLDLTRIRLAGGMPVERARVDLAEISSRAVEELKAAHPAARLRLEVDGDVSGDWDADRLLQVVSNLVANAIQHGRGREITLHLTRSAADVVELCVHNAGAIPEDLLPLLFDPFRGSQARGKRRGLGLGLFISKHIVEAHGGSIEVDSSETGGTTFTVRLPRRPDYAAQAEGAQPGA